jgi:hypothetical protein
MIEFPQDFKEFLQLLNSKKIEYLVIGGYAVGYHGYPRATGDMDIWISMDEQTAVNMVEALKEFGFDTPELTKDIFMKEHQVVRMGTPPMRLEILTYIDGVYFKTCFENRVVVSFDDFSANFISKADLLTNKRSSARPQDLVDFEKLKKTKN